MGRLLPARFLRAYRYASARARSLAFDAVQDFFPPGTSPEPYRLRRPQTPLKDRPRIVHAIGNLVIGGSSQLVVDLIERLGHLYEQEVLVPERPWRAAYEGLAVHECPRGAGPGPVLRFFRGFKPDLIHVHYWEDASWYPDVFAAARLYGGRVIENVNTPVAPHACASVRRYVYVSDYVREAFGFPGQKQLTIHPGSDFSVFPGRRGPPAEDCLGMVCRLEPDKLDERSLDAFIRVVRRRPRTRCLIVGGGSLLRDYRKAVARAGSSRAFEFTGYVPYRELPALYERMSVFVAPVRRESFGSVSPYAMGMGLPVAGYRVGGLGEILGTDRTLAPPGDSEALAEILIGLLDGRSQRLAAGEANQRRARSLFAVEGMIERYRSLYDELLREPA